MNYLNGLYSKTPINKTEIGQSLLNIDSKTRSNPLTWKAQFSPQLIEALLKKYAKEGMIILDPFVGSGTVLLESGYQKMHAIGTEINPAAVYISNLYKLINLDHKKRNEIIEFIEDNPTPEMPMMDNNRVTRLYCKRLINKANGNKYKKVVAEAIIVLSDFLKASNPANKITQTRKRVAKLLKELPYSEAKILVFNKDARKTGLRTSSVNLVITSPPYINVYNYHQQYRDSAEFLGERILEIAKSEIGSNRKHRSNRFLTVIQYCLDIEAVLKELIRVCKNNSRIIFIVGRESRVKKTPFNNGELVTEIAHRSFGLKLILKQERFFKNKFGKTIYEDILHFKINKSKNKGQFARDVAKEALLEALKHAPATSTDNIKEAINEISKVEQSPILNNL